MYMRLDRTLSLHLVQPLMRMGAHSHKIALPILMYHSISDDPEPGVRAYYKLTTSPALFEQHLLWLNAKGFRSVDLNDAVRSLQQGKSRGENGETFVVITFDDGFRDFFDVAFPLLKKHGHIATVYLPTAFIGDSRRSFKNKECLTWQEVRELRVEGIQFGSHTVNHPKLSELSWKDIEGELTFSKKRIEQELGEKVAAFAYPYAFPQEDQRFVGRFTDALSRLGYQNCVTTVVGRARAGDGAFRVRRLPVNSGDDEALFEAKLAGAYDWIGRAQRVFRQLMRRKSCAADE